MKLPVRKIVRKTLEKTVSPSILEKNIPNRIPLSTKIHEANNIIREATKKYEKIGLGFSGGTDSTVLLHLVYPYKPDIPVVFINTYNQFPETISFVHETVQDLNLNFFEYKASENKHEEFRNKMWNIKDQALEKLGKCNKNKKTRFIAKCCVYHKITPLLKAIKTLELNAFFVGIRGSEHEERAKAGIFEQKTGHVRVHPILNWTIRDVLEFTKIYGINTNVLYQKSYVSLGCMFCTKKSLRLVERGGRDPVRDLIQKELRAAGYT